MIKQKRQCSSYHNSYKTAKAQKWRKSHLLEIRQNTSPSFKLASETLINSLTISFSSSGEQGNEQAPGELDITILDHNPTINKIEFLTSPNSNLKTQPNSIHQPQQREIESDSKPQIASAGGREGSRTNEKGQTTARKRERESRLGPSSCVPFFQLCKLAL